MDELEEALAFLADVAPAAAGDERGGGRGRGRPATVNEDEKTKNLHWRRVRGTNKKDKIAVKFLERLETTTAQSSRVTVCVC